MLLRAAEIDEGDRGPIERLRANHWVRSSRTGTATALDTVHDRVREAMLEGLAAPIRRRLHRQIAIALETLADPPHDRLARHFAAAHERRLAFHHAVEAAEVAHGALALRRAAELYGMAISLGSDEDVRDLYPTYAESLTAAGRHDAAGEAWLEASRRAEGGEARDRLRRAGEAKLHAGRIDEGLDLLDELASEIGVRVPQHRWAVVWVLLKEQARLAIRGLGFRMRAPSEIRQIELDRVRTLGAIALAYLPLDPFRGAVPTIRYLRAALELGDADEVATATALDALVRTGFGWRRGAARLVNLLEELTKNRGRAQDRVWASTARSLACLVDGDRNAARAHTDEAFELIKTIPTPPTWVVSMAHYCEGFSLIYETSGAAFARVLAFVDAQEERSGPCAELRLRGLVAQVHNLLVGRPESVLALANDTRWTSATKREVALRSTADLYSVVAHLYLGDAARALVLAEEVRAAFRRQGATWSSLGRGPLLWFTAASALGAGARNVVRRSLEELGVPKDDFLLSHRYLIGGMSAAAAGETAQMQRELRCLRLLAAKRGFSVFESLACWVLGRAEPGPNGDEARARYLETIEGTGIVDPDLFFWSRFPIGERPPRTGGLRSCWS